MICYSSIVLMLRNTFLIRDEVLAVCVYLDISRVYLDIISERINLFYFHPSDFPWEYVMPV